MSGPPNRCRALVAKDIRFSHRVPCSEQVSQPVCVAILELAREVGSCCLVVYEIEPFGRHASLCLRFLELLTLSSKLSDGGIAGSLSPSRGLQACDALISQGVLVVGLGSILRFCRVRWGNLLEICYGIS